MLQASEIGRNEMLAQYQLGVVNRCARQLVACSSYAELFRVIDSMVQNLEIGGYVRVIGHEYTATRKVGISGLRREALEALPKLVKQKEKIARHAPLMLCQWPDVLLVTDTRRLDDHSCSQLQDSLAIAMDGIQVWLERQYELLSTKAGIYQQLFEFKQYIQSGMECMNQQQKELHTDLISRIASHLPVLGLELDQEERILDTFSPIISAMDQGLMQHCEESKGFIELINVTLEYLASETQCGFLEDDAESVVLF